jgi:general secretion pathway protein N
LIQSRSRLLTVGLFTLVVGLLVFFPARVAYRWFVPDGVLLSGISGSIWSGSARAAQAGGVHVRDLTWHMRPLALLRGKLGYAIEAIPGSGFVDGNLAVGVTGIVTFTDLRASMSLQSIRQSIGIPGLQGSVNVQFERLVIDAGFPVTADGSLEVSDLVAPMVHRASIGGYRAEFFTQDSGVMASVEDTDGLVDIAGILQVSADRSYKFVAQLAPKSNTPSGLRQQMQFLGSTNERGQYELRLEGEL